MKLTKEMIDKVRHIEGFPIGSDEDIIALSQPPYYTACPNPFIEDFIKRHGKPFDEKNDNYKVEPFATDVSESKADSIYNIHNYHTKVPYKAIMRYILHYTEPGDIVFDGFSGSGMTGVAAQICAKPFKEVKQVFENEIPDIKWGPRFSILNDLSTVASFVSHNYNSTIDFDIFENEIPHILSDFDKELGWFYETNHISNDRENLRLDISDCSKGVINYTVWSDVFICPNCSNEIVFYGANQNDNGSVSESFSCSKCGVNLNKRMCDRAIVTSYDDILKKTITLARQEPVMINYSFNGKEYTKTPDSYDIDLINKIDSLKIPFEIPIEKLPYGVNTEQPRNSHGIEYLHHFYTKRNLHVISYLFNRLRQVDSNKIGKVKFVLEQILMGMAKISRYVPNHYSQVNQYLSGTLYIGSQVVEVSPNYILKNKLKMLPKAFTKINANSNNCIVSTGSSTELPISNNSIDYIFTDPPFGSNLNYSELSFIWESWLKVKTNNSEEAIINKAQSKNIKEYQNLMARCFDEFQRILKPGRWMTVEFHNSQNSVWNSIQDALQKSGFIIADVRILDKQQGSFKQVTTTTAVKKDLVISAYKPKDSFRREFISHQGTVQTAWDFVRQHLEKLPVVVHKGNKIEIIVERQDFLLFDRMIAFHIVNSISVPLDAADFYKGLDEKFVKRDNMYFLHDQVNEYDNARIQNDVEDIQFSLFVSNEKTAIAWLYQQLVIPQTYSMIQPKFMQEIRSIDKYEKLPELLELLEENFLKENNGEWYIPDVNKATDVIRLREKKLVKEFEEYLSTSGKLKKFRTEAVRAGFAKLWKDKNFDLIVKTAERLPEEVVQEDEKLLMYYDLSLSRLG